MTVHTAPKTLLDQLAEAGIAYELLPHRRTMTAAAEAEALDIEPSQVAKTLVLTTPAGFVLAVLPASERLDLRKVRAFLDTKGVELASEETLTGAYPEFELGAVPRRVLMAIACSSTCGSARTSTWCSRPARTSSRCE